MDLKRSDKNKPRVNTAKSTHKSKLKLSQKTLLQDKATNLKRSTNIKMPGDHGDTAKTRKIKTRISSSEESKAEGLTHKENARIKKTKYKVPRRLK